jgi:uncharacterized repeat protein (TIGR02543 family)
MKKIIFALTLVVLFATCKKEEKKQTSTPTPTQSGPTTFTVKYFGNGNSSGTVPADGNSYSNGDKAFILGNTGGLAKTGFSFLGWNSDTSGTGTNYCVGDSVAITNVNLKLYAKWISSTFNPSSFNSTLTCGGSGWSNPSCTSSSSLTLKAVNGLTEVTLMFSTIPITGSYNVHSTASPTNVQVTVLNAPGQPCGLMWYGKVGTVNVITASNSINASFNGIQCVQFSHNFPVVSLSGSVSCN